MSDRHGLDEAEIAALTKAGEVGFLHSFEAGSAVDGPGVRVVLWTAGCHFRCLYCHNPDTWKLRGGRLVTLADTTTRIARYRGFWSGGGDAGGVTVSGGEPLVQGPFTRRIFAACRRLGIHTTLDTNGFLGHELSDADLADIDLVLLDLKAHSPSRHLALTGQSNEPVLAFGHRLAERRRPVWVRFVLVPGVTDDASDVDDLARLVATWPNVARVEVLPFHQLGRFKWERLGMPYRLSDVEPPTPELLRQVRERFRAAGNPRVA